MPLRIAVAAGWSDSRRASRRRTVPQRPRASPLRRSPSGATGLLVPAPCLALLHLLQRGVQPAPVAPAVHQRARVEPRPRRAQDPARAAQVPAELRGQLPRLAHVVVHRLTGVEQRARGVGAVHAVPPGPAPLARDPARDAGVVRPAPVGVRLARPAPAAHRAEGDAGGLGMVRGRGGRWLRTAIAGAATLAVAGALFVAGMRGGYPTTRPQLLSGAAWLASAQVGQVTLLDGSSAEVAAQVQVANRGDRLDVVQQAATAYAVNRST